jgi:hypothetical protein
MLFSGGFTFSNFLADVLSIFIFVLWFWLLITVFGITQPARRTRRSSYW